MKWGPLYQDTGLVFTREDGRMVHPERLSDWFGQHVKAAGLPPIRLHDTRQQLRDRRPLGKHRAQDRL